MSCCRSNGLAASATTSSRIEKERCAFSRPRLGAESKVDVVAEILVHPAYRIYGLLSMFNIREIIYEVHV